MPPNEIYHTTETSLFQTFKSAKFMKNKNDLVRYLLDNEKESSLIKCIDPFICYLCTGVNIVCPCKNPDNCRPFDPIDIYRQNNSRGSTAIFDRAYALQMESRNRCIIGKKHHPLRNYTYKQLSHDLRLWVTNMKKYASLNYCIELGYVDDLNFPKYNVINTEDRWFMDSLVEDLCLVDSRDCWSPGRLYNVDLDGMRAATLSSITNTFNRLRQHNWDHYDTRLYFRHYNTFTVKDNRMMKENFPLQLNLLHIIITMDGILDRRQLIPEAIEKHFMYVHLLQLMLTND
jgi:hypothetical protein